MKSIEITNFQSHKATKLNLDEGINVIVGNSDCGKSAILRSIVWLLTNKPSGDSFVSNSIKDSKGKVKGTCTVSIDGVARIKGKDFNGYNVSGVEFEALRTDVPDAVKNCFNLGDVNIQNQLDGPFMLSNTPGENAKYINSIVDLEIIDKSNSWINEKILEIGRNQKYLNSDISKLESKLLDEDKLSGLELIVSNLEEIELANNNLTFEVSSLQESIRKFESVKSYDLEKIESLKSISDCIEGFERNLLLIQQEVRNLNIQVEQYSSRKIPDSRKLEVLKESYDNLVKSDYLKNTLSQEVQNIVSGIRTSIELNSKNMHLKAAVESLKSELDGMVCPLCGRIGCVEDV